MDFRRCFGLRAPRPIGDSTILAPQLENYSLFAAPFLDLNTRISKLTKDVQKDVESQSEDGLKGKRKAKKAAQTNKKDEGDGEKPCKESSEAGDSFGIVLNVVAVKPNHIAITFGEGNEIEVKVQQRNVKSEYGSVPFSRNCTYKYELPGNVDKNSLVALWTSDDYLIILPKDHLREDLLEECIGVPEELEEFSVSDVVPPVKATGSTDLNDKAKSIPGSSKSEEKKTKKPLKSDDGIEKTKSKKDSDKDAGELVAEKRKKPPKLETENCDIPIRLVTRMLRPGMDIFMLRKYMVDLESYISTARKFIENSSFLMQNSKSAERCIRFLAKSHADEVFEKPNLGGDDRRRRRAGAPSEDDSGLGSSAQSDDSSKENLWDSKPQMADKPKNLQESQPQMASESRGNLSESNPIVSGLLQQKTPEKK